MKQISHSDFFHVNLYMYDVSAFRMMPQLSHDHLCAELSLLYSPSNFDWKFVWLPWLYLALGILVSCWCVHFYFLYWALHSFRVEWLSMSEIHCSMCGIFAIGYPCLLKNLIFIRVISTQPLNVSIFSIAHLNFSTFSITHPILLIWPLFLTELFEI